MHLPGFGRREENASKLSQYYGQLPKGYKTNNSNRGRQNSYKSIGGSTTRIDKGPFLWTCMYNGLLRMKLPNGASLVGFADDLALLVVAEKAWLVEIIANEALELIAE